MPKGVYKLSFRLPFGCHDIPWICIKIRPLGAVGCENRLVFSLAKQVIFKLGLSLSDTFTHFLPLSPLSMYLCISPL